MAQWEPPNDFRAARASSKDIREMDAMTKRRNTCPYCGQVYRTHDSSRDCETWHEVFFRKARSDAADAMYAATTNADEKHRQAKAADARGDAKLAKQLRRERDDFMRQSVRLERQMNQYPKV